MRYDWENDDLTPRSLPALESVYTNNGYDFGDPDDRPDAFKSMTPEKLAEYMAGPHMLTEQKILEAMEQGRKDAAQARQGLVRWPRMI